MLALKLTIKSFKNRKLNIALALLSILLGAALFTAVEQVRTGVKKSFSNTISGTDLIVGARSGPTSLLLSTVFHIGAPTNNVSYQTFKHFQNHKAVKWAVPVSLGDSHRGYRVIGTTEQFFEKYRYGNKQLLQFQKGGPFKKLTDVVIGADVAEKLNYKPGDSLVLSHGLSAKSFQQHTDTPFKVIGVLKKTGTPVDRSLYTSLKAIEAIHIGWENGVPTATEKKIDKEKLNVESISAFFLRCTSRIDVLRLQREVAEYKTEPLTAVIPGLTLARLWDQLGNLEAGFLSISAMVILVSLVGMLIAVTASLSERRREIAILRSLGAGPVKIFTIMTVESTVLAFTGGLLGILGAFIAMFALKGLIADLSGIYLVTGMPGIKEMLYLLILTFAGFLTGLVPAVKAYRMTVKDGLTIKI